MTEPNDMTVHIASSKRTIDTAIRIGLIAMLIYWCMLIFEPFVIPLLWAIIIAVAIYPLYVRFEALLSGRKMLALSLFTVLALALLITPTVMLVTSMADTLQEASTHLRDGSLRVPPPPAGVAEWPLVGEEVHEIWSAASANLVGTVEEYAPHLRSIGEWLLATVAGAGMGVLQFVVSILIAAVLMAHVESADRFARSLAIRLAGDAGKDFATLAGATMRSVAQGVLGVAAIQSILAGIGMLIMGVPGAGVWALLVLMLAVVQLPVLLILVPVIIYVFTIAGTVPAILFMVWTILVGLSDNVLKPLLMGRGVDIPMLIILIGAIGGMLLHGILGLFIGSVVLALGYKLFLAWLAQDFSPDETTLRHKAIPPLD